MLYSMLGYPLCSCSVDATPVELHPQNINREKMDRYSVPKRRSSITTRCRGNIQKNSYQQKFCILYA